MVDKKVVQYIKDCLKMGHDKEKIEKKLIEAGYEKHAIISAFFKVEEDRNRLERKLPKPPKFKQRKQLFKKLIKHMKNVLAGKNVSNLDIIRPQMIQTILELQEIFTITNNETGETSTKKDFEKLDNDKLYELFNTLIEKLESIV